ncbi:MAG: IS256 family transposase [candidate division Zixibacteria bacterium]|nr:IS256 family transposase [candidate division Zixibacteria bacterium]
MRSYDKNEAQSTEEFGKSLDEIAREGALKMLKDALEAEVEDFLGRGRYQRSEDYSGYRNGFGKKRKVVVGSGTLELQAPRVRDALVPFESDVLHKYQRQSDEVKSLIPELYLHGLATGDFELAMRGLLGDGASLSAASVSRLKEKWEDEYNSWRRRDLSSHKYVYMWCDGIYPKAGLSDDKLALLVVLGVNKNGIKEPLAIFEGYRESKESWGNVLHDLKERGLTDPKLFIGDGALGLWAAIGEVYPHADWQRCWCHKMRNVISYFPKRLKAEAAFYLKEMYNAATEEKAISLINDFAGRYAREYPLAVECLKKDQDVLLTFFCYPREHWASIKTTNPIESVFSSVRLRTNAARRIKSPRSALFLIFQIILRAQKRWRSINAPEMIQKVIDGVKFKDGVEVKEVKQRKTKREMVAA